MSVAADRDEGAIMSTKLPAIIVPGAASQMEWIQLKYECRLRAGEA
jgi:hypothetical protein